MSKTDNTANQNSRANQNTASNQQSPENQQSSKLHPDVKNYVKLFFKENKLVAFLSMIVFIALSMIYTAISWILQIIFDYMAGKGTFSLTTILLLVVSFMLVISLIFALKRSAYPRFLEKAMNQHKESVIKKLLKKSYSDFSLANSGTYLSVLTNDCERIQEKYLKKIFDFVQDVLMLVSSLALMIYYSPLLTVIALIVSVLPMACSILTANGIATREEQVSKSNESYTALTKDVLNGVSVIKSFKAEQEVINRYQNQSMELEHTKNLREKTMTTVSALGTISSLATQLGVMLVGAWMVNAHVGVITAGMVLAFTNLMNGVLQPIASLPQMLGEMKGAKKLISKMADYMSNVKEDSGDIIDDSIKSIVLRDVSYSYDADRKVLKNVNLTLQAGKSYAIVGPSGAGKSSLINLLMGYYKDYEGSVQLNNHELSNVSKSSLYDKTTLMQQSVFMFDASILDNITLFKPFQDAEVDRVIHLAGLDDLISAKGKDYQCGENGSHLSGGEKQRIAIARSLLKKSEILLVDEATSALDNETSANVTQSILDLQGILRLVVTHRLDANSLKQYDEILVMKSGELIERGSFEELMNQKAYFYSLYTVSM
ncbi:ABC transporter ATP-binding protein [Gardnerella vaginalis]|nr:ABC transporter ATP-binding protein [Gardnerella vaginalis]KOS08832.1 ABC transporter ATP-binding protein [Gardnerella vaginalis]TCH81129.1 ABC transporter ATP-binding protein [Gardnerella vaginalis]TCH82372.1 ABC transporter ATP-binding protein [Gardnerella vaginalis ATCC 14018 = JCM 11026]SDR72277.1 ABC-type bacteriocin/lantibiotic exporter, contains an N-terminal double-glycine peptidase domain [Gardnerella vaginalis]VEH17686.1 Probable multidrug resistance ABC transporter ATP-binding/pe